MWLVFFLTHILCRPLKHSPNSLCNCPQKIRGMITSSYFRIGTWYNPRNTRMHTERRAEGAQKVLVLLPIKLGGFRWWLKWDETICVEQQCRARGGPFTCWSALSPSEQMINRCLCQVWLPQAAQPSPLTTLNLSWGPSWWWYMEYMHSTTQ